MRQRPYHAIRHSKGRSHSLGTRNGTRGYGCSLPLICFVRIIASTSSHPFLFKLRTHTLLFSIFLKKYSACSSPHSIPLSATITVDLIIQYAFSSFYFIFSIFFLSTTNPYRVGVLPTGESTLPVTALRRSMWLCLGGWIGDPSLPLCVRATKDTHIVRDRQ